MRAPHYTYAPAHAIADGLLVDATPQTIGLGFGRPVVIDTYAYGDTVACYVEADGEPDRLIEVLGAARTALADAPAAAVRVGFSVHRLLDGVLAPVHLVVEDAPDHDGGMLWLISLEREVPRGEWTPLQELAFRLERGFTRVGRTDLDTGWAGVLAGVLTDAADRAESVGAPGAQDRFLRFLREALATFADEPEIARELRTVIRTVELDLAASTPPIRVEKAANHWARALKPFRV